MFEKPVCLKLLWVTLSGTNRCTEQGIQCYSAGRPYTLSHGGVMSPFLKIIHSEDGSGRSGVCAPYISPWSCILKRFLALGRIDSHTHSLCGKCGGVNKNILISIWSRLRFWQYRTMQSTGLTSHIVVFQNLKITFTWFARNTPVIVDMSCVSMTHWEQRQTCTFYSAKHLKTFLTTTPSTPLSGAHTGTSMSSSGMWGGRMCRVLLKKHQIFQVWVKRSNHHGSSLPSSRGPVTAHDTKENFFSL